MFFKIEYSQTEQLVVTHLAAIQNLLRTSEKPENLNHRFLLDVLAKVLIETRNIPALIFPLDNDLQSDYFNEALVNEYNFIRTLPECDLLDEETKRKICVPPEHVRSGPLRNTYGIVLHQDDMYVFAYVDPIPSWRIIENDHTADYDALKKIILESRRLESITRAEIEIIKRVIPSDLNKPNLKMTFEVLIHMNQCLRKIINACKHDKYEILGSLLGFVGIFVGGMSLQIAQQYLVATLLGHTIKVANMILLSKILVCLLAMFVVPLLAAILYIQIKEWQCKARLNAMDRLVQEPISYDTNEALLSPLQTISYKKNEQSMTLQSTAPNMVRFFSQHQDEFDRMSGVSTSFSR